MYMVFNNNLKGIVECFFIQNIVLEFHKNKQVAQRATIAHLRTSFFK